MYVRIDPKINIDPARVAMKIRKAAEKSLQPICDQILMDTNQYVPNRSGTLESTANARYFSGEPKAEIKWTTIYANYVYKGISKRGKPLKYTKHPNEKAGAEWCKRAKKLHLLEWQKRAEKLMKKEFKNG